jgi:hypothetical protein
MNLGCVLCINYTFPLISAVPWDACRSRKLQGWSLGGLKSWIVSCLGLFLCTFFFVTLCIISSSMSTWVPVSPCNISYNPKVHCD